MGRCPDLLCENPTDSLPRPAVTLHFIQNFINVRKLRNRTTKMVLRLDQRRLQELPVCVHVFFIIRYWRKVTQHKGYRSGCILATITDFSCISVS